MPQQHVVTPAADFLADAGKFLYGKSDWLGPFAADLGVKPVMLHNWLKGRGKLLGNHPVLKRALRLVEERLDQQRDGWRAKCEELEDAAMPDAPAGGPTLQWRGAPSPTPDKHLAAHRANRSVLVDRADPANDDQARAKVRRHK